MRKRPLTLHLYAGLIAGVFIVILGVTGSIMAFEEQIDHVFHPRLFDVTPQVRALSLADLGAAASKTFPGEHPGAYGLSVSPDLSYSVNFRSGTVFVNQYTGEVLVSLIFLLCLTITGVVIGFEHVTTPMFFRITGSEPLRATFQPHPQPGAAPKTPDQAVDIARAALPGAAPIAVNVPGPTAVYRVALQYPEGR